ncbi:MAG: DUF6534 domain-containing protein [Pleurocapsa sp.]
MTVVNYIEQKYSSAENKPNSNILKKLLVLSINTGLIISTVALLLSSKATKTYAQTVDYSVDSSLLNQIDRYSTPENDDA